jgi:hypothetical protein
MGHARAPAQAPHRLTLMSSNVPGLALKLR